MFPEQNKNIHKVLWHKEQELETKMSWEGEIDQNSFSITFISGANDYSLIKNVAARWSLKTKILHNCLKCVIFLLFFIFQWVALQDSLKNPIIACDIISWLSIVS